MKKQICFFAFILCLCAAALHSIEIPALTGRINDGANIIDSKDKEELDSYLSAVEEATGIQIAVLTVKSIEDDSIESFAHEAAETWKLGQSGKDNGALLVVAFAERKIRIEVGYGLEDKLTDTKCGMIIRNEIVPAFRNGNYSEGILNGVKTLGTIAAGNEVYGESNKKDAESDGSPLAGLLFILFWFVVFSSLSAGRKHRFVPWFLLSSALGGRSSGYSGSSRSYHSSGFSSSPSGKSFSGGGGHFGGGGASGGW